MDIRQRPSLRCRGFADSLCQRVPAARAGNQLPDIGVVRSAGHRLPGRNDVLHPTEPHGMSWICGGGRQYFAPDNQCGCQGTYPARWTECLVYTHVFSYRMALEADLGNGGYDGGEGVPQAVKGEPGQVVLPHKPGKGQGQGVGGIGHPLGVQDHVVGGAVNRLAFL